MGEKEKTSMKPLNERRETFGIELPLSPELYMSSLTKIAHTPVEDPTKEEQDPMTIAKAKELVVDTAQAPLAANLGDLMKGGYGE